MFIYKETEEYWVFGQKKKKNKRFDNKEKLVGAPRSLIRLK